MDKNFIVKQIDVLVESYKLWSEMANHIEALGGELWSTKYAEAYNFHSDLVYDLIIEHRGYPTLDESEYDCFQETVFNLSQEEETKLYTDTNEVVAVITSAEELYEWMVQVKEDFIPKEENLN